MMKTETHLKAGGWTNNHNETPVRDPQAANLKMKTHVRAGTETLSLNFNKVSWKYWP